MKGKPLMFQDPRVLKEMIDNYFAECDKKGKPYTSTGLALALGTNRMTLWNYRQAVGDTEDEMERAVYGEMIDTAMTRVENFYEEGLSDKDRPTQGQIFALKGGFKWVEKQEIAHEGGVNVQIVNYQKDGDTEDTV